MSEEHGSQPAGSKALAAGEEAADGTKARPRRGRPRLDDEMVPRILDAAERLFAASAGAKVTVRDIAAEAGVAHAIIYRYFASKDDVLRRVLQRGRLRQVERDERSRETGDTLEGATDWFMRENRGFVLAVVRAVLEGESPASLGIDPADSSAAVLTRLIEAGTYPFRVQRGFDPRLVAAATVALGMGWAVAEDWVLESAGLKGEDLEGIRRQLSELMGSIIALAGPAREE